MNRVVRFENFELDLAVSELRKDGQLIRLQDQPARLLVLLVTRAGDLVTRAEIQKSLWGDDKFVEFDHAINTAMRKIREVLGDDPDKPRLIETVPRKGYRFIGTLEGVVPPPAVAPQLPKNLSWFLFMTIQAGYLLIYCAALYYMADLEDALAGAGFVPVTVTYPLVLVTAMCGIAVRLYLFSAVGWQHPDAGRKFTRLFPYLLVLDAIWAGSPLLAARAIGSGIALAGVAGMAYLPFSQRTLMGAIYRESPS